MEHESGSEQSDMTRNCKKRRDVPCQHHGSEERREGAAEHMSSHPIPSNGMASGLAPVSAAPPVVGHHGAEEPNACKGDSKLLPPVLRGARGKEKGNEERWRKERKRD